MASVSSISSTTGSTYSVSSSNDEIAILEKQKVALQKDLQEVTQSKDDAKTKELKTKQIQLQIQQIDARIQQAKANKSKQSQSSGTEAVSDKTTENEQSKTADLKKRASTDNTIDLQA